MKLYKKNLDKLVKITWKDAKTEIGASLEEFIRKGFMTVISIGWVRRFDKKQVTISFSYTDLATEEDLTMIPMDWITEVEVIGE